MSSVRGESLEPSADARPQLRHRVSIHELTAAVEDPTSPRPFHRNHTQSNMHQQPSQQHHQQLYQPNHHQASPRSPSPPSSHLQQQHLHRHTLNDRNPAPSNAPMPSRSDSSEVADLRSQIECLEDTVERLAEEKHALKLRLNEVEYGNKFQLGHCKRWLTSNFDFDRKDSPDLLAGMIEDYLSQNDSFEPLPHQILVKNSARGRTRRDKLVQQRLQQRGIKRDTKPAGANGNGDVTAAVTSTPAAGANNTNATATSSVHNVFISLDEIERLLSLTPWRSLPTECPPIVVNNVTPAAQELVATQEALLQEHALAIWERCHWFPIKDENGRSEAEAKRLHQLHNRRKRRQQNFKIYFEQLAASMQKLGVERAVLRQSVFSPESMDHLLKRPRLWIPREPVDLVAQLEEIDRVEPDRRKYWWR